MSSPYDYEKDPEGAPGDEKYGDFYRKLRSTVQSYVSGHTGSSIANMLLCLPDFFYLLVKLSTDPEVPKGSKAQIVAALAYFLSPVDVIPDIIPGLGLLDDLYLAMIVTDNLLQSVSPDVIARYWPGDADLVGLIKTTLDKLNDKLGTGAIRRILARFKADNTRR
jgi:uncharacterized membrane protein YkvA (DUF1232 family)